MIKIKLSILFFFSFGMAIDFLPINEHSLNYTQIFFRWPQVVGAESYEVIITNNIETTISITQDNSAILNDFLWGEEYSWEVCGLDSSNDIISCYEQKYFTINSLPLNYPGNVNVITYDENISQPGITVLDYESLNFSVALDADGDPIWFADKANFPSSKIIVTDFLKNGNFIGFGSLGYEFDLNSNIIYQTPTNVHHSIIKSDLGTFFYLGGTSQMFPCPDLNFCNDELMSWKGDRFIETNEIGEIVWEWDVFDYIPLSEFNSQWIGFPTENQIDWTHSNSIFFDIETNLVLISMRNLSRITAIDYSTKEIVWNMGNADFMDEVYFDNDFEFSHQHSAQITYDQNLLFFDNGRFKNPELSRCVEIDLNDGEEPEFVWEYILPDSMLTLPRGECDRLLNGNTLITAGRTGNVIEVDQNNQIVWHLRAKVNNDLDVNIYRSERVPDLYPNVFSVKINNLIGSFPIYSIVENNIEFIISNKGWSSQLFRFELFDSSNILINSGEVLISSSDEVSIGIDLLNDINSYSLNVFPENRMDLEQRIRFDRTVMMGDLNNDFIINILDILIMVNIILGSSNDPGNADMNGDNLVNILDIVSLVDTIMGD